ncbi:hypothetical protein ACH5RR_008504, partial [Cinchona calisaya]
GTSSKQTRSSRYFQQPVIEAENLNSIQQQQEDILESSTAREDIPESNSLLTEVMDDHVAVLHQEDIGGEGNLTDTDAIDPLENDDVQEPGGICRFIFKNKSFLTLVPSSLSMGRGWEDLCGTD